MASLILFLLLSLGARADNCAKLVEDCLDDYASYDFNYRIVACSGGANQCSENPANPHVAKACLKVLSYRAGLSLIEGASFSQRSGVCAKALSNCGKEEAIRLQQKLEGKSVDLKASCTKWAKNTAEPIVQSKDLLGSVPDATKPVATSPQPAKERRYRYELAYSIFLSNRSECFEKEAPRKLKFCARLYADSDSVEGRTGRMPDELASAVADAEVAKLRLAPVRLLVDFAHKGECKAEIQRLSSLHKSLADFFVPYSKDLDHVCQAIIDDELPALWQFTKGPRPRVLLGTRKN